jgi:hypothetical protein
MLTEMRRSAKFFIRYSALVALVFAVAVATASGSSWWWVFPASWVVVWVILTPITIVGNALLEWAGRE